MSNEHQISQLKTFTVFTLKLTGTTHFSILEKVHTFPAFVSTSKSKVLVLPALLAKFTAANSSNLICIGGLCTKMKPLSSGYKSPVAAL